MNIRGPCGTQMILAGPLLVANCLQHQLSPAQAKTWTSPSGSTLYTLPKTFPQTIWTSPSTQNRPLHTSKKKLLLSSLYHPTPNFPSFKSNDLSRVALFLHIWIFMLSVHNRHPHLVLTDIFQRTVTLTLERGSRILPGAHGKHRIFSPFFRSSPM